MGQHPRRANVPRVGDYECAIAVMERTKVLSFFYLCPHCLVCPVQKLSPAFSKQSEAKRPLLHLIGEGSNMTAILTLGTVAPDFSLPVAPDKQLSLSDLRGKPVILAFYPADWSPVCGDQMALYNEVLPEFKRFGAELIGISVDGAWCHAAYAKDHHLHFPLAADFEPKGEVSRAYGAYREKEGFSERALFVLDKNGVVTWSYLSPVSVNPGADGILEALEELEK
jgi:peroxiredoxin